MNARLAVAALLVLILAGCGVPTDDRPRAVGTPPFGPFPTPGTAVSEPAGRFTETLYFVRGDRLVLVNRRLDTLPAVDQHLAHLLAGPNEAERNDGLTTALPGAVTGAGVRLTGARAEVDFPPAVDDAGRSDEVFAFAQIVCTLTARPEVVAVSFLRDGQPLEVPRADGSLSQGPLTAADYVDLAVPG
ncbi:GerMN domain-containing protein [Salinispora arenicola]|uniref:GerMN domain-containing protein n=1 Tax=Salinispora arenicola (strain CNS-205) TaxID=391037 RepID=A8M5N1_SALAI|nr:GerMN domain-containing protein [Salinispora arenicola]NIL61026.1 GerMN domain-containing protein [Salinispora arenicola]